MAAIIELSGVSKRYVLQHQRTQSFQEMLVNWFHGLHPNDEVFWALRDVSFGVEQGETFGLVGANGSGKSTALKIITKVLNPDAGGVRVNGVISALIELGAGFHPDLSGRENIFLLGSILGIPRKTMLKRFDDIVG
ncbi:MAG: ATP-binding cassette domain-containing protein, partial [Chloroflexi bacterium]|nr:ATP-binding cassette domain-containing protein [Chloroflexota bacterium]